MSKTLDGNGVARGKVIEKTQEVLELMKQQGAWVMPDVNNDF
jgi:RNase P/RNase MRP subunit p29